MQVQREDIRAQLALYLERTGTSQAQVSKQIGCSTAMLSMVMNRNWQSISEEMWRKIERYVCPSDWQMLETTHFATITRDCAKAQRHCKLKAIVGKAGLGKTSALRQYKLQVPNTYYVLCQQAMNVKELLKAIGQELGIEVGGTKHKILSRIGDRLTELERPLLILDDAGKLNHQGLSIIQQIYDLTERKAGIILSAVDYMYDNIKRGVESNKTGYPELKSRIGHFRRLPVRPSRTELEMVAKANGVDNRDFIDFIAKTCESFRDVREVVDTIRFFSEDNQREISLTELKEIYA